MIEIFSPSFFSVYLFLRPWICLSVHMCKYIYFPSWSYPQLPFAARNGYEGARHRISDLIHYLVLGI